MKSRIQLLVWGITIIVLTLAVTSRVLADGTVNFGNCSSNLIINGQTLSPVSSGDNIKAALYWSPSGSNTFSQLGAAVTVGTPLSGVFVGGTRTTGAATPGGSSAQFQVRAWGGGYATYEQAAHVNGVLIGQSAVFNNQTGNPTGTPPTPPESLLAGEFINVGGLKSFTLTTNIVPQLTSLVFTNGFKKINGLGGSNRTYGIEAASNLIAPINWQRIGSNTAGVSGLFQFTDTNASAIPIQFYRAVFP